MTRPLARWNPATSAVASPNLRVRLITEIRSPEESSRWTSDASSGLGPSSTTMTSYGALNASSPCRYSAKSAGTSAAWRLPTGMMTEISTLALAESVMAGSASDEQVLGEAGELMLAQVSELVDELANRAGGEQHHGRGEEDHARPGDGQRHPALRREREARPPQRQCSGSQHRQRQHPEPEHRPCGERGHRFDDHQVEQHLVDA